MYQTGREAPPFKGKQAMKQVELRRNGSDYVVTNFDADAYGGPLTIYKSDSSTPGYWKHWKSGWTGSTLFATKRDVVAYLNGDAELQEMLT
mgnify:CR=1 FL=1